MTSSGRAHLVALVLSLESIATLGCSKGGVVDLSGGAGGTSSNAGTGTPVGNAGSTSTGAIPWCGDGVKNEDESDVDCGGSCPKCPVGKACSATGDCASGVCSNGTCAPCSSGADCPAGLACASGVCGGCSASSPCDAGLACVTGSCRACQTAAECGTGKVCDFGACVTGYEVQMYQCPASVSLGGGAWGYYGCQSQITNTPSCKEIEAPTTQSFPCTAVGKLAIVTGNDPAPAGTTYVPMYQCPGQVTLGGGSWGFYGCQNQITNTSTCNEIEYPSSQSFNCTPIGKMSLASSPPAPPPGGQNVPMYQCPGVVTLGGGAWGFYGCQNQLTNVSSCYEIEAPTQQSFTCSPAGTMQLSP